MKLFRLFSFTLVVSFLLIDVMYAQDPRPDFKPESVQCLNDHYRQELYNSFNERVSSITKCLKPRSNNGNFEVHFYIDTSYERRRVGAYNKNGEVISYMNTLASNVISKFNVAAPNWDVNKELSVTFFDSLTPFSYGNGIVETIENFTDWLINNNFPGNHDVYVLYTGRYTNVGVTYLGTLCLPGVSLMGYVSSQIPNEALSSHEWVGHAANSLHYDNSANIMKSNNATFPWHSNSLFEIEDYLDFTSCVDNFQSPLALNDFDFYASCNGDQIFFEWDVLYANPGDHFIIQSSADESLWYNMQQVESDGRLSYQFSMSNTAQAFSKYRIKYENNQVGESHYSNILQNPCKGKRNYYFLNKTLYNPSHESIQIFNLSGIEILQSSDLEIDLNNWQGNTLYFIKINGATDKFFLH